MAVDFRAGSRRAAALMSFGPIVVDPSPRQRRFFEGWRDFVRTSSVYRYSPAVDPGVAAQVLRGGSLEQLVGKYSPSGSLSLVHAFLAWQSYSRLLQLMHDEERAGHTVPDEQQLERLMHRFPVEVLLFRARAKYKPEIWMRDGQVQGAAGLPGPRDKKNQDRAMTARERGWDSSRVRASDASSSRWTNRGHENVPPSTRTGIQQACQRLHACQQNTEAATQRKRERQQQHQQQREESELTGRPAICAWTAPTNRVIKGETIEDSLLRRAKKQQSRLEWMQRQAASEEKERTNTRKYMAVKTAVMTEGRQRALPVEDLLIAQGELSKQRKNYLRQIQEQQERIEIEMGPSITASADRHERSSERDVDICEALYRDAQSASAREQALRELPQVDAATGQRLFRPVIPQNHWELRRDEPVEDALLAAGSVYRSRREQLEKRQKGYDDEIMVERVPKMAPRSRMIAELMEMRDGGEQVAKRLSRPTRTVRASTVEALEEHAASNTFHPALPRRQSYREQVGAVESGDVFERLHASAVEQIARSARLSQPF